MPKMLDLFCGTKSMAKAFERAGWKTYTVDWDEQFEPTLCCDVNTLTVDKIIELCDGVPDFVHMSPDCFPAGNLVWTNKGYKDIEDIQEGDCVLTHLGNYKNVHRKITKQTDEFCKIKISGCEEFLVTPNHPFYVRKKRRFYYRENGIQVARTKLLDPEWIEAKDLNNEYCVGIPINNESKIPTWQGTKKHRNNGMVYCIENKLQKYMDNKDFWWIIGRYIGDGSVSLEKSTVEICCEKGEDFEILEHLIKLDINYTHRRKLTTNAFNLYGKEICEFVLQFGKGSLGKTITPDILNLPIDLLQSFLYGYISADGCLNTYFKNNSYHITTISKNLAYGLQMCLLKAFGRYASLVIRKTQNNIILGRKVNTHPAYTLCFYKDFNEKRMQYRIENNMAWVNIRNNTKITEELQNVYTMSVIDDESFTINNVSVHNCSSYSVAAIFHHRKQNKETGELEAITEYAEFCDKTNAYIIDLVVNKLKPKYWTIENPRAGMRKMSFVKDLPRYTTTYCQWGDTRMKPTDIWTNIPNPNFPCCRNGDNCHEKAPRGSRTGTQGIKGAKDRSRIPDALCDYIVELCNKNITIQND